MPNSATTTTSTAARTKVALTSATRPLLARHSAHAITSRVQRPGGGVREDLAVVTTLRLHGRRESDADERDGQRRHHVRDDGGVADLLQLRRRAHRPDGHRAGGEQAGEQDQARYRDDGGQQHGDRTQQPVQESLGGSRAFTVGQRTRRRAQRAGDDRDSIGVRQRIEALRAAHESFACRLGARDVRPTREAEERELLGRSGRCRCPRRLRRERRRVERGVRGAPARGWRPRSGRRRPSAGVGVRVGGRYRVQTGATRRIPRSPTRRRAVPTTSR